MSEQLYAVLIGGGLAVGGVLVAELRTLALDRRQREERKLTHRREKYEEFCDVFVDVLGWHKHFGSSRTLEEVCTRQPPPTARRLITLATLYFPDLLDPTADFVNGLTDFYCWSVDYFRREGPSIGAQTSSAPDSEAQHRQIIKLKSTLERAIQQGVGKYIKA